MAKKTCVGLACIRFDPAFWGFKESQYKNRVSQVRQVCRELGLNFYAVPQSFEDAKGARAAARELNQKADIVILDIAAYPEGKAANVFAETITAPLILWSRNETMHNTNIAHNSFCGANFLGGSLTVQGYRFRQVYGLPQSKDFKARLLTAARLVGAAKAAAGAKIALFGEGIVPKFYDIDINAKDRKTLEKRWGIKFVGVPTAKLIKQAKSYKDAKVKAATKNFVRHFTSIEISAEAIEKQSRMFLAIRDIYKEGKFASLAVRCWPELQGLYEAWPCPTLSVLNEIGVPAACEGDLGGALDMLLAKKLSKDASTLVDIVDWDDKGDNFSIWHCGPTAHSWADKRGSRLIGHNVDGCGPGGKPKFGLPGIVDMQFAPGKVTVFRTLGAIDEEFAIQASIVTAPRQNICGSFGAVTKSSMYADKVNTASVRRAIFDRLLPHHYTATPGHIFS